MEIFTKICHCDEEELSNKNCTGPAVCEGCGRNICCKEKNRQISMGQMKKMLIFVILVRWIKRV